MFEKITLIIILANTLFADVVSVKEYSIILERMSYRQELVMEEIDDTCRPYDLSLTCVAISLKESQLGKWALNPTTGDYGVMHINLKTFMRDNKLKESYYNKLYYASLLTRDDNFNINAGIKNLLHWKKKHRGNWRKMVGSYNAGNTPNKQYAADVLNALRAYKYWKKKHIDR